MKRTLILCLILCLGLCACQKSEPTESNKSNVNSSEKYETTLIRRLTGTENIDNISDFAIGDTYGNESVIITDKKDLNFLKQYTYVGELPKNEINEIFKYPDTKMVILKSNNGDLSFFIFSDGRIAIQVMCGDSLVPESERTYEIYTADKENMLTEKKINKLLEKYDLVNKNSIVYNLTKKENFDDILSFVISHKYDDEPTTISDKNDLRFLNYYYNSDEQYPMDKLDELFAFPQNTVLTIKVEGGYEKPHYLLNDGSIVVPQDKSDTDTTEVSYDIFRADTEHTLTEGKLIALLKKYDGYK